MANETQTVGESRTFRRYRDGDSKPDAWQEYIFKAGHT